jgi:hypothetical protein
MTVKIGTVHVLTFTKKDEVVEFIHNIAVGFTPNEAVPFSVHSYGGEKIYVIARKGGTKGVELQVWGYCMRKRASEWVSVLDSTPLRFKQCLDCGSPLLPNNHAHGLCRACYSLRGKSSASSRSCRDRKERYFASWGVCDGRMRDFYGTKRELINRLKRINSTTYIDDLRVTKDEINGKVLHDETTSGFFSDDEWYEMTGCAPRNEAGDVVHRIISPLPVEAINDLFPVWGREEEFAVHHISTDDVHNTITLHLTHRLRWNEAYKHLTSIFPGAAISTTIPTHDFDMIRVVVSGSVKTDTTTYRECFTVVFRGLYRWVSRIMFPFIERGREWQNIPRYSSHPLLRGQ